MLKRFGTQLVGGCGYINHATLQKTNIKKYLAKFRQAVKEKKVYVVDDTDWSESFLGEWFIENYSTLDFQEVFEERSKPYMDLKAKLNFYGFPDFLATREGKILRVELECFSSQFKYMHNAGYCEVVLCYEADEVIEDVEIHELKRILGYENIINKREIIDYMYIQYADFKRELDIESQDEAMKASE